MASASRSVYTSSATGHGHVVNFGVEQQLNDSKLTVVHLPRICEVNTKGATPDNETMFHQGEYGIIEPNFGFITQPMFDAVTELIKFTYVPFHVRLGIRVLSTPDGAVVVFVRRNNVEVDEVCKALALAIYRDVTRSDWQYVDGHTMTEQMIEDRKAYDLDY